MMAVVKTKRCRVQWKNSERTKNEPGGMYQTLEEKILNVRRWHIAEKK